METFNQSPQQKSLGPVRPRQVVAPRTASPAQRAATSTAGAPTPVANWDWQALGPWPIMAHHGALGTGDEDDLVYLWWEYDTYDDYGVSILVYLSWCIYDDLVYL